MIYYICNAIFCNKNVINLWPTNSPTGLERAPEESQSTYLETLHLPAEDLLTMFLCGYPSLLQGSIVRVPLVLINPLRLVVHLTVQQLALRALQLFLCAAASGLLRTGVFFRSGYCWRPRTLKSFRGSCWLLRRHTTPSSLRSSILTHHLQLKVRNL